MEVIEEGDGWIGLYGIVRLDPGESGLPSLDFPLGLSLVIEQAACLHLVFFQDLVNFLGLTLREQAVVVPSQKVH